MHRDYRMAYPHSRLSNSHSSILSNRESRKALISAYCAIPLCMGIASKFPMQPLSRFERVFQVTKSGLHSTSIVNHPVISKSSRETALLFIIWELGRDRFLGSKSAEQGVESVVAVLRTTDLLLIPICKPRGGRRIWRDERHRRVLLSACGD